MCRSDPRRHRHHPPPSRQTTRKVTGQASGGCAIDLRSTSSTDKTSCLGGAGLRLYCGDESIESKGGHLGDGLSHRGGVHQRSEFEIPDDLRRRAPGVTLPT